MSKLSLEFWNTIPDHGYIAEWHTVLQFEVPHAAPTDTPVDRRLWPLAEIADQILTAFFPSH